MSVGAPPPQCHTPLKSPQGLRDFYQVKVASVSVVYLGVCKIALKIQRL